MDDWMAVASLGFYPTPGVTLSQRAALAASWGLLYSLTEGEAIVSATISRRYFSMMQNYKQYPRKYTM